LILDFAGQTHKLFKNPNKGIKGQTLVEKKDLNKLLPKQINSKYTSRNSKQDTTIISKTNKLPIKTAPSNNLKTAYQNFMKTTAQENKKPRKNLCLMKSNDENIESGREEFADTPANRTIANINDSKLHQRTKQHLNYTIIRKEVKSVTEAHENIPKSNPKIFIKTQRKTEAQPRVFKGSFSLLCTSMRSAFEIIEEISKLLSLHKVKYKKTGGYLFTCQKQTIKFEIEVMQMESIEFMHVVRFKRLEGNSMEYKIICSKLFSAIKL